MLSKSSETILHKTIRIPAENSLEIMTKLGSLHNFIEFENLNKDVIESQKPYFSMIQRCDDLESIFKNLDNILLEEFDLKYEQYRNYEYFKMHLDRDISYKVKKYNENYFDLIENEVNEDYKKIKEQIKLNRASNENYLALLEYKYVLEKLFLLFSAGELIVEENEQFQNIQNVDNEQEEKDNFFKINYIAGLCNSEDKLKISKLIFRKGRDRAIPNFFEIKIKENDRGVQEHFKNKVIFLICIQGEFLINKIKELLKLFNCSEYEFTHNANLFDELNKVNKQIMEEKKLYSEGKALLKNLLSSKAKILNQKKEWNNINNINEDGQINNSYLSLYALYRMYFKIQKLIYINLNKCLDKGQFLIGEVWIPEIYFPELQKEIKTLLKENERLLLPQFEDFEQENNRTFRTFFRTNDFSYPFQEIVNTYGIPRYKEANPGLFTIITFPFLFGIMFGDIGHGTLLLLFSIYICKKKNDIYNSDSILKGLLKFRFLLLIMGFFSLFCGLIYNDFMGIPLTIFNSCYENDIVLKKVIRKDQCIYPIGMDPKWYSSHNELAFFNSFKMKWSVIIGVFQMVIGIFLRGLNNLYFNDTLGFFFEFIPQIIFFLLLFVYMIVLIYIKWITDYSLDTSRAPSIITILMNLALKQGSVEGKPVWGTVLMEEKVNKLFFYFSILCIPIILLVKPIVKIIRMKNDEEKEENDDNYMNLLNNNYNELFLDYIKQQQNKHEGITDIFVHQIIETNEFVLGCISNTASYLRLWALSLAHSQLGKVFFEKCVLNVAQAYNFIFIIIGYFLFANITVSVLMGMDLLEAFLHTLRLHWVEFQNKFYYADGVLFEPFSFKILFDNDE